MITQSDGEAAGDGAMEATGGGTHPGQGDAGGFGFGDSIGFCGEAGAPHFGQNVEVAAWGFGHETLHATDVFKGSTPLDVTL